MNDQDRKDLIYDFALQLKQFCSPEGLAEMSEITIEDWNTSPDSEGEILSYEDWIKTVRTVRFCNGNTQRWNVYDRGTFFEVFELFK